MQQVRRLYLIAPLCVLGCGNDLGFEVVDAGDLSGRGLPCDVQTFLAENCQSCHGTEPVNDAPMSLMTYQDLMTKSPTGATYAQRALIRMKSTTTPMPPAPAVAANTDQIAMLQTWVLAGSPPGDCVAPPSVFDGPTVCTSGRRWNDDDDGSPRMLPGRACITCHRSSDDDDAPRFRIAGTVYPTGHEPNDCLGAPSGTVEVTDANGNVTMLPVNASGNFFTTAALPFPIRVAVLANGKRRAMGASPPVGDCNSCHTPDGANGAPGRIALP
jgi:mono/diheme cytochrome c family protein